MGELQIFFFLRSRDTLYPASPEAVVWPIRREYHSGKRVTIYFTKYSIIQWQA
jgi:hypothetical protein